MKGFWENIKFFVSGHRVASIATAGVVGVSAVGAGGFAAYNAFSDNKEPELEIVEVEEKAATGDIYIPQFKSVVLTSESIEKDITIYISEPTTGDDEESDTCITGVPFQVKMISVEDGESLQSYADAITSIDEQIKEYTSAYDETYSVNDILQDRNVDVTITDENNEVIDTEAGDITTDPLYQLYLDKETALQAYTLALNELEGPVYTDDDEDGVISETDVEPGDYVACIVNSTDEGATAYQPETMETAVNVKDKVEFVVQEEIQKQVKEDVASEDGQVEEAVPVEATLTDTVAFVDSKKVENGGSYKETTDAVAPTTTASSSKATVKSGGKTSTEHNVTTTSRTRVRNNGAVAGSTNPYALVAVSLVQVAAVDGEEPATEETPTVTEPEQEETKPATYTVTIKCVSGDSTIKTETKENIEAGEQTFSAPAVDGYTVTGESSKKVTVSGDTTVTFTYKNNEPEKYTVTVKYQDVDGNTLKGDYTESVEAGNHTYTAPTIEGYDISGNSEKTIKVPDTVTVTFKYTKKPVTTTTTEKATLDMSYSAGTFTISATTNVSSVKVNDTAVSMSGGKGTYKASKDGDYKLTGVATFSDGATDNSLNVTYTVSGYGTGSSEKLKDSKGNQLYLDNEGKTEATAADYEKGKTYYYKEAAYTYYGWQTIDGTTKYFDGNGNYVTGEQVIQGVKYNFGSDGALLVNGVGIDVSKHQGSIDWSQAGPAVSFAIVRCGYRGMYDGQLHEDSYFYKNMSGAKSNGVSTGIYVYSTALNEAEAVAEASMAVSMANKAGGCSLPIFIDMEDSVRGQRSLSNAQRTAIINAFCSTVQSGGYKAGVYANKTWMTNYINTSSLSSSCYIWVAQYNTSCSYTGRKSIWQYSSKGSIPGIKGNVDVNKSYF